MRCDRSVGSVFVFGEFTFAALAASNERINERINEREKQMDPEEKEKMEKRDWLAEKIQMLNTQLEGFEADVEKAVSM